MAQDLSQVTVSRKQALAIMEQVRPRLVERLKNGMQREDANREVADWLRGENNILSPYADEVVAGLLVSDNEIAWRREFGDEFCDAWAKAMNGIKNSNDYECSNIKRFVFRQCAEDAGVAVAQTRQ